MSVHTLYVVEEPGYYSLSCVRYFAHHLPAYKYKYTNFGYEGSRGGSCVKHTALAMIK